MVSPDVAEYTWRVALGEAVFIPTSVAAYNVSPSKVRLALPAATLEEFLYTT
jgi:hypothetical protein